MRRHPRQRPQRRGSPVQSSQIKPGFFFGNKTTPKR
jgi:hypothetical protein